MIRRLLAPGAGLVLLAAGQSTSAEDRSSAQQFLLNGQAVQPSIARSFRRPARVRPQTPPAVADKAAVPPKAASKPGFVVAVFGDALAYSIARGLDDIHSDKQLGVFDATSETNGLTQDSVGAWTTSLEAVTADTGRIDAAVIMLGSADLQPLTTDAGSRETFGTPGWRASYGDRVQRLAAVFRDKHIPLIWVGLPVVRDDAQASRFADINTIARERAAAGGAAYIDSWEAFVNDGGQYDASGPDVNGQVAKLRRNDGVGFTKAGADKLASFVDVELQPLQDRAESSRRLAAVTPDADAVFDEALQIDVNAQIRREAGLDPAAPKTEPPRETVGKVVLLTAPPVTAGGQLATSAAVPRPGEDVEAVLVRGIAPPPQPGRTDDFAWPRP